MLEGQKGFKSGAHRAAALLPLPPPLALPKVVGKTTAMEYST